jgi:hypothetical protein
MSASSLAHPPVRPPPPPRTCHACPVAGSTGLFVFGYSIFFYFERSNMFGFMQTAFFFGYMAMMSFAAFCMLGVIGFFSGFAFVTRIYKAIKCD